MSLLHPTEDDEAFAEGHREAGERKKLNRIWRVTKLLRQLHAAVDKDIVRLDIDEYTRADIERALRTTWYDEPDDGMRRSGEAQQPPPLDSGAASEPVIIGLDLSLKSPAAVAIPNGWRPDKWQQLQTANWRGALANAHKVMWKEKVAHEQDVARLQHIGAWVTAWVLMKRGGTETRVYVEDYAYSRPFGREALAELGGVIRTMLYEKGIVVEGVNAASARKTLLGRVPTRKKSGIPVKDHVNHELSKMGANFDTMDEGDAFVIANHARALLGLSHVSVASDKSKPSKKGKRS